ncbi:hypothetical protein F511_16272 [Dorcoceras hygrometricum]|uniref:Uncharacterized protein n=1 Tax=Dorcoceras hygrometricum TaxID=472368 RepID=A0A2Z7CHI0_9LAMI|nr:hypothetical protein F511_16272 [Dorcoceras hygrometricum]
MIGLAPIIVLRRFRPWKNPSVLLVQIDGGILIPVVDLIRRIYRLLQFKSQISLRILVGARRLDASKITQSTAELTADATSFHLVQKFTAAGFLELKSVQGTNNKSKVQNNEECSPKSLNPQEKCTTQISQKASNASNSTLPDSALIQGLKWVAIKRAKLGEFNATKIIKNRGWTRRESAVESYGEQ